MKQKQVPESFLRVGERWNAVFGCGGNNESRGQPGHPYRNATGPRPQDHADSGRQHRVPD